MPRATSRAGNERGATLVFVAMLLVALFGLMSVAIDVGVWLNTRSEAQRVADAAALAGAGMFMLPPSAGNRVQMAEVEARRFAGLNYVGRSLVASDAGDDSQVDVEVISAEQKVRVTIRGNTPSIFARLLGMDLLNVRARAAARVFDASAAKCVKPFAVPDLWEGAALNQATAYTNQRYEPHDPFNPSPSATGYGSRQAPYGSLASLVIVDAHQAVVPSVALPIALDTDPKLAKQCPTTGKPGGDKGGGDDKGKDKDGEDKGGDNGGGDPDYRSNICNCNNTDFRLGNPGYPVLTSSTAKQGNAYQGLMSLIERDADAEWDATHNTVHKSSFANWLDSPRVIKIALFDPAQLPGLTSGAGNKIAFNNVALFWLEEPLGTGANIEAVQGRFIGFPAQGSEGGGATTGPNVMILQLVE